MSWRLLESSCRNSAAWPMHWCHLSHPGGSKSRNWSKSINLKRGIGLKGVIGLQVDLELLRCEVGVCVCVSPLFPSLRLAKSCTWGSGGSLFEVLQNEALPLPWLQRAPWLCGLCALLLLLMWWNSASRKLLASKSLLTEDSLLQHQTRLQILMKYEIHFSLAIFESYSKRFQLPAC